MAIAPSRASSVADRAHVRSSRTPAPRPLTALLFVGANVCVIIAVAYFALGRSDLPSFLPHAQAASHDADAHDFGMAAIAFGCAIAFLYAGNYSRTHRSWLRSRSWNRRHGRV